MLAELNISSWEIVTLIVCIVGSSFFSGSEAILMSLGIDRANQLMTEGGSKKRAMVFMIERPNQLLTTILVGNNVVNIGAASLTTVIVNRLVSDSGVAIATGITTFVILIFGEIIPKTFARKHAEKLSVFTILILQSFYYLFYFLIEPIVFVIQFILGSNAELTGKIVRKDDIEYLVNKAEKEKSIDSKQIDLLNSILEFPTIKVKDIMISRLDVKYLKTDKSFLDILEFVKEDNFSRYPVCTEELEDTIGFLHVKDLAFVKESDRQDFDITKCLKEPFFVYEHMKIQAVFDYMNRKKVHLALVKDENGVVVGIVTLEDIIEEIVGDILDEHDIEEEEVSEDDLLNTDGAIIDGGISLRDLHNDYNIKIDLNDNFSTLAGFLLDQLGNSFPEKGLIIVWEGFSFELFDVEDSEIKDVRVRSLTKSHPSGPESKTQTTIKNVRKN